MQNDHSDSRPETESEHLVATSTEQAAPPAETGVGYATIPVPVTQEQYGQTYVQDIPANPVIETLLRKIKAGRSSLLSIAILSVLNMALIFTDTAIRFPFSLSFPSIAVYFAQGMGIPELVIVAAVLGLLDAGFFLLLYFLSKKSIWPITLALICFILDTLMLVGIILLDLSAAADFMIEIAFHVWALVSIIGLLSNAAKLKKMTVPAFVPVAAHYNVGPEIK